MLDASNNIVSANDYDCWGYPLENRSYQSGNTDYKFTGKQRDRESGYDYFGARYYDAKVGNWGSVDPLFEKHIGWTPYNYVLRNPMVLIDPDGMQDHSITLQEARELGKSALTEFFETIAPILNIPTSSFTIIVQSVCFGEKLSKNAQLFPEAGPNDWVWSGPIGGEITVIANDAHKGFLSEGTEKNEDGKLVGTDKESNKKTDLRALDKKEAKKYAEEKGYDKVEKYKEDVLGGSKIDKKRAGSYDIYKDKKTGDHYLKPKSQFGKKLPTIKIKD